MAKTYTIHYSTKDARRGSGNNLSKLSSPTQFRAGEDSSNKYGVHCLFSGLSGISAANVTGITLHLQRIAGGSTITYSVTLYHSVLSSTIASDDADGRLRTGYAIFCDNRKQWSWEGASSDVGGEYRTISIPISQFDALKNNGWAIAHHSMYSSGRSINIGDVYLTVATKETDYKLSYNANGGSGAPAAQTGTGVGSYTFKLSAAKPTRTGYTFQGWATTAGATSAAYQPGGSVKVTANTTLHAVWQANTYTVTYKANGGAGADVVQNVTYGKAWVSNAGASFSRPGYKLLGWANTADATAQVFGLGLTQPVWERTSNRTLYAVWLVQSIVHVKGADGRMHDGVVYVKGADGQMHVGIVYVVGADGNLHVNG